MDYRRDIKRGIAQITGKFFDENEQRIKPGSGI